MIYGREDNGQFARVFQSVAAIPMSHTLETVVDPMSEIVYAPRPRPLADVLRAVDTDPELTGRFDLYYDFVMPLRAAEGR